MQSKKPADEKQSRENFENAEETVATTEKMSNEETSVRSTIAAHSEEEVEDEPKETQLQNQNISSISINENNTTMQAIPSNEDESGKPKLEQKTIPTREEHDEILAKFEPNFPPFTNTSSSTAQPVASNISEIKVQQPSMTTTIPASKDTSPHTMMESTQSITNLTFLVDSVGTTTIKQKKRRRKTTTTTHTTTTTTTTEASIDQSYGC